MAPVERNPSEQRDDEQRLAALAEELADAVDAAIGPWIERLVLDRVRAWSGHVSAEVAASAVTAGEAARDELMPVLRRLLAADPDLQATNPLSLLRAVTGYATEVLDEVGVPAMPRDRFARDAFPGDRHGLIPATWADIDPALHAPGLAWGAAKAYVVRARRRDRGGLP